MTRRGQSVVLVILVVVLVLAAFVAIVLFRQWVEGQETSLFPTTATHTSSGSLTTLIPAQGVPPWLEPMAILALVFVAAAVIAIVWMLIRDRSR